MKTNLSRRDFFVRSSAAAIAASLWPGRMFADEAKGEAGEFDFIQVNDVHFTDPKKCPPWFEKAFAAMRESAPKAEFLIVSGDLSSENTDMELGGLKDLFPLLKIPVHVMPGNHDTAADGDQSHFEKNFPGALNYAVEHRGWQLFCVNSAESRAAENTKIPAATLAWCDDNVKKFDPKKPTILSTHFPLGYAIARRPKNADALLDKFKDFNVQAIFNGHWHGYSEMMFHDAPVTTDRCCSRHRSNHDGSPKKGWFVCEARAGRISRRFVCAPAELLKPAKDSAGY